MNDYNECETDNEVGATISACFIASVDEEYIARFKEDDQAVTWEEIVRAGEKDSEYVSVKKAILDGFPEKLEECIPLIQPHHKN